MATVNYMAPIREIKGAICPEDGNIHKSNKYVLDGQVVGQSKKIVYHRKKRDFKKRPMHGEELANALSFGEAIRLAREQRADPVLLAQWKERFLAQCKRAEAGKKQYVKFDAYMIAMIRLGR